MLRLTFTLAAAIYAGFIVWGEPDSANTVARELPAPTLVSTGLGDSTASIIGSTREAGVLVSRDTVLDPAAIAASTPAPSDTSKPRLIGEPVVVSLVAPSRPATVEEVERGSGLLRVTGSRVNMRSGPGTANAVVDSLPRGTLAEPIGTPIDGWQEIRDVESGLTGFMSARFLEPDE